MVNLKRYFTVDEEEIEVKTYTFRMIFGLLMVLALVLSACSPAATPTPAEEPVTPPEEPEEEMEDLVTISAGWVGAIDQLGLPVAVEQGFFEEEGLDVVLAGPYPTGVDLLNALQAGEVQFGQVGVPAIGAILRGMDLVMLGNYTGSSTQLGIDETMAMVAREGSGIEGNDLANTLPGKTIGAAVGSISHLYLLGVLEEAGIAPEEVEIVNTPPPDMPVALQTGGVDAIAIWDPWPIVALADVAGTYEVVRGGGYISFIGYIVAERSWVEQNPDIVDSFLTARAKADLWIRENPDEAARVAVRWLPGTREEIAMDAMQFNIQQLDPRFSACNYLALHNSQQLLNNLGAIEGSFDVNLHFEPGYILQVMADSPELFQDLGAVPAGAEIGPGYSFSPDEAAQVCR
jgi:sulfonate transport system substrate-binding protein